MDPERLGLARKYIAEKGDPRRVLELFEGPGTLPPSTPEENYVVGVARFRLKQFALPELAFKTAVADRPDDHMGMYYLGLTFERQGQEQRALSAYRAAAALKPGFTSAPKKLQYFGVEAAGTQTATRSEQLNKASLSELHIPETPDELERYVEARRAKARADFKIDQWSGRPWGYRALMVLFWLAFVGWIAWLVASGARAGLFG